MIAKFAGVCTGCRTRFPAGSEVWWDQASKSVTRCPGCNGGGRAAVAGGVADGNGHGNGTSGSGAADDLTDLRGIVAKVTFARSDFVIAKLANGETVKGNLGPVEAGTPVVLTGRWQTDPKYGRQFQAVACEVERPSDPSGAARYFARFDGIGPVRAARLVQALGVAGVFEAVDSGNAGALASAADIPPEVAAKLVAQAGGTAERGKRKALVFLIDTCGLTGYTAERVLRDSGIAADQIEAVLRANPYILIQHVDRFGWVKADTLARKLGVPRDAPVRVAEGWRHVFRLAEDDGHTAAGLDRLLHGAGDRTPGTLDLLDLPESVVSAAFAALITSKQVVEHNAGSGVVVYQRAGTAAAEATIATRLTVLARGARDRADAWAREAGEITEAIDVIGALAGEPEVSA